MDPIPIQRHDNVPPDAGLRSVGVDARFKASRESEGRGEDDIAVAAKSGGLPAAPERGVHHHVERVRGCFVPVLQRVLRGMGPSGRTERDLSAGGDLVVRRRRRREREREAPPVVGRRGVSPDAPIGAAAQASRSLREVRLGRGNSRPRCELPGAEAAGGGGEDDRRGVRTAPRRLLPEEGGWQNPAEDEGGLGDDDASGEEGGGGVELLGGRHRGGEKSHAGEAAQEGALGEALQPRKGQGREQEAESKAVFARPYIDISNAGGCASRFFECIRLQLKITIRYISILLYCAAFW